ncbi:NAD-dependent epimerase/dehydratase family protein [Actinoplanes sp. NPDC051411]|uniref:SDR family oxidoreductase n=1 Tax=Actinoplanes sp. NPDC051411 TaxID=3155522 RepID=UPI003427D2C1
MTQLRIAVAGGTGWIGRLVVAAAHDAGHDAVVLARSTGVDLITGRGLAEALRGADVVIDVANLNSNRGAKATAFFETATRNLLAAEAEAGVGHHVILSIVAVDRVAVGYYEAKRHQEEVALAGPVPVSILRATQFFEFAVQMTDHAVGPFVPAPRLLTQPVSAREVAAELVRIAAGPPQGDKIEQMAGPEELRLDKLVRQVIKTRGLRRIAVPLRFPGKAGREQANGGLLPRGEVLIGKIPYAEWLSSPDGHATAP